MNYLISKFACSIYADEVYEKIYPYVKYEISGRLSHALVMGGGLPFSFDCDVQKNVLKIEYKQDIYYFLFPYNVDSTRVVKISHSGKEILFSLSDKILLTISGDIVVDKYVDGVEYSHHEIQGKLCLIYFVGKRNFIIILEDDKLKYADYYDEYNESGEEKYFMTRLYDALNHGRVLHIKDKKYDDYLVYLDDEDMCLRDEFVGCVFLDCVRAKNFKYAKELLHENIKLDKAEDIGLFFPEFCEMYPVSESEFFLINKNALAGICIFDIQNKLIHNITIQ
ncbi:MAG: hypothetical protein E7351_01150 [Clostridiales bacterium]|nr:hypothetical protein [Clostridiales bacterium]